MKTMHQPLGFVLSRATIGLSSMLLAFSGGCAGDVEQPQSGEISLAQGSQNPGPQNQNSQPLVVEIFPKSGPAGIMLQVNIQGIGEGKNVSLPGLFFGDVFLQLPLPVTCHPFPGGCTLNVTVPPRIPSADLTVCVRARQEPSNQCTTRTLFTYVL